MGFELMICCEQMSDLTAGEGAEAVAGRRVKYETKARMVWGSFLIAPAALKTPTRNGCNAQGVHLAICCEQVSDLTAGEGAEAVAGRRVKVRYRGKLASGKQFDAGDISFRLGSGEVIKVSSLALKKNWRLGAGTISRLCALLLWCELYAMRDKKMMSYAQLFLTKHTKNGRAD